MTRAGTRRFLSDWLVWVMIGSVIMALAGYFDMARDIGQPFGGYISFRPTAAGTGEVDANTPIWWSGLLGDRLDHGDTLVLVGDTSYYPGLRERLAQVYQSGEQSVQLTVIPRDADEAVSIDIPLQIFTLKYFMDARLPDMIISLVFWLLAVVVYISWPDGPANRAFALTASVVTVVRSLFIHTVFMDDSFSITIEVILQALIPILGVTFLFFATKFPVQTRSSWRWLIIIGIVISGLVTLAAVALRWPGLGSIMNIPPEVIRNVLYFGSLFVYFMGLVAIFGRLIHRLVWRRNEISKRERRMLNIVLIGFIISIPILLSSALTWLAVDGEQVSVYWQGLDTRYLLLAIPLTMAYVLVRYQALRSPSRLFIGVMVLSASALIAAIGAWLWTLDHEIWPGSGLRPPFMILFLVALFSSAMWLVLTSLRGPMSRTFQYDRHANQAARVFGHRLMNETNYQQLPQAIALTLVETFDLERAAIWLGNAGEPLTLAAMEGVFIDSPPLRLSVPPADSLNRPSRVDRQNGQTNWLIPITGKEFELAIPLSSGNEVIGLIALGPHWDAEIFDERRIETAELVGQYSTLILVTARNIEELRQVPGRMAEVQERERERLAQELHDTIQQFLGRLPFYLAVGRDAVYDQPELTQEILNQAISDVDSASGEVRQIRHNLAPSQLQQGLVSSLFALAHHFQHRTGVRASVEVPGSVDERLNQASRHALYRVIQQALDNVEAHAEATTVCISLQVLPDRVAFSVKDDGGGVSEEGRQTALGLGSFGIESMRARLEACGGEFSFDSIAGQGTTVSGWVPCPPVEGQTPGDRLKSAEGTPE